MKIGGWCLIALGALIVIVAIVLPTTVPVDGYEMAAAAGLPASSVANLGLMERQIVVLFIGLAMLLAGCGFVAAGHIAEALEPRPADRPTPQPESLVSAPAAPSETPAEAEPDPVAPERHWPMQAEESPIERWVFVAGLCIVAIFALVLLAIDLTSK